MNASRRDFLATAGATLGLAGVNDDEKFLLIASAVRSQGMAMRLTVELVGQTIPGCLDHVTFTPEIWSCLDHHEGFAAVRAGCLGKQ